jgi:uncharacterized protein
MALPNDEAGLLHTVYFLALLNPDDQLHQAAVAFSRNARQPLVTTEWILTEVGDALAQPVNRPRFGQLLTILSRSATTEVVHADSTWFKRGCELFLARPDKEWSLTDCISFLVMEDRGLSDALTHDHHFKQVGFEVLLKE